MEDTLLVLQFLFWCAVIIGVIVTLSYFVGKLLSRLMGCDYKELDDDINLAKQKLAEERQELYRLKGE